MRRALPATALLLVPLPGPVTACDCAWTAGGKNCGAKDTSRCWVECCGAARGAHGPPQSRDSICAWASGGKNCGHNDHPDLYWSVCCGDMGHAPYVNHFPRHDDPFGVLSAGGADDDGTTFAFLLADHGLAQVADHAGDPSCVNATLCEHVDDTPVWGTDGTNGPCCQVSPHLTSISPQPRLGSVLTSPHLASPVTSPHLASPPTRLTLASPGASPLASPRAARRWSPTRCVRCARRSSRKANG